MHDHQIYDPILALIVIGYLVIAFQFRKIVYSTSHKMAGKSIFWLISIFILCSLSGYVPRFFSWWPHWLEEFTHGLLVISTWAYIFTNQASKIVRYFNGL